ncbi:MAG: Xaa-Pro aminopeptidase [Deltaproteobacteria bacterium]|nr:Xaa-Pro aminopeptidase [Deltaproteobacteria bacterium]
METSTFVERRKRLREMVPDGAILILGQAEASRNYPANTYPFRQDSHFSYLTGVSAADLALLILPDGQEALLGPAEDPDDLVWHGPHPLLADHARDAGIRATGDVAALGTRVAELRAKGLKIHYLPPYRGERALKLAAVLGKSADEAAAGASRELARAVVGMRSIKTDREVAEIEKALEVSATMYETAFLLVGEGRTEAEVAGAMQGVALSFDCQQSFAPIVSVHGEVLHNTSYAGTMRAGELLLIDSGVEAAGTLYCSDITRTLPVSGKFLPEQRALYEVVLAAHDAAIALASPKVSNRDLHFAAARAIAAGLKDVGLMRGSTDDAVAAGAHALFFPHGIGHMLGLDVHDMEDLGDVVGYPEGEPRSKQFGLAFLRLAKSLSPGFVVTIEPGIYFVPALIDRWMNEKKHEAFICYDKVERFRAFGGIRLEDDLLVTAGGHRVLGPQIPITVAEVEEAMRRA